METARSSRWEDACCAAAVLAVDPLGVGGVSLRSAPGPVRERWLAQFAEIASPRAARMHRVPLHVTDGRLLGGLDLVATLKVGRPIVERGILCAADGGVVVLAMAERLTPAAAGKITSVLDTRETILERDGLAMRARSRFGVIALDEGIDAEERPPLSVLDRLGLHVDLNGIAVAMTTGIGYSARDTADARGRLARVRVGDEVLVALCETAAALGVDSGRVPLLALRVARAAAALAGREEVVEEDAALAARLVFAPRATKAPPAKAEEDARGEAGGGETLEGAEDGAGPPDAGAHDDAGGQDGPGAQDEATRSSANPADTLRDRVFAAAQAALPPDVLARLRPGATGAARGRQSGRAGEEQISRLRGRPAGTCTGNPSAGARINIIATLRAAAPWQRLRRAAATKASRSAAPWERLRRAAAPCIPAAPIIHVRRADFRLTRFKRRTQTTTIFLVDASGSAALNRLAEVKGAVELLLAESYVRRDRVALIAFRGIAAQVLLPPTSSLVRVKRELASLPGGGGTPLAAGLDAAWVLSDSIRRRGETPLVVVLTDGRPNISRDGGSNRQRAESDALGAARKLRAESVSVLLVDTAPQPRALTAQLAGEMRANYLPLPYADAGMLAGVVHRNGAAGRKMAGQYVHG
jgi:magnesium chelatase subunit D